MKMIVEVIQGTDASATPQASSLLGSYVMEYAILVDGYNVIKKNLMFQNLEIKNLALARNTLIKQLKNRYRQTSYQVIVVFDGNDSREQVTHDDYIRVIFSCYGQTADSVIVRLTTEARKAGREVILYSDDEEVKQNVAQQGGTFQATRQLVARINAAPRDVALLIITIPFVLYGMFRYLYLVYIRMEGGSPEEVLLRDRPMLGTVMVCAILIIAVLYLLPS